MNQLRVSTTSVRLADGRRLAFGDAGPLDGQAVIYIHGALGAPLDCHGEFAEALEELGIRLLMPQRPGFGESTAHPGRCLQDFVRDLEQLTDALRIDRFGVVGVSAGGPYAVACAHGFDDRLTAAAVVSSLSPLCAPVDVPGLPRRIRLPLRALAAAPKLTARLGDRAVALVQRHPVLLQRAMTVGAPPVDRVHAATNSHAHSSFLTAARGGVAGLVEDHLVTSRPWGFPLDEVRGEVHVWHGMADAFVPADHALHLVASLPRCRAWFDPGEGHFFFRRRARDILATLCGDTLAV
ncbi:alpha/beta fold hydrolase [Solirubrobacter sp. CPCC 204708]|uniref:Alpha/beta hydrolase n=1 Tax=Solirubrobacter deserti TaxID=2282478 RepID=A0ABT4RNR6_9ACTN|nr:alpha/beta fold hydrolase [Solirubrobacter deserti]MBE2314915.1 alpha/beta fold hydrolase [Solirubrobacter deserti]MDA0140146.1 alpha/beta hydrolase [Solirubrobacter deserti]